jgi:hypothetical protein
MIKVRLEHCVGLIVFSGATMLSFSRSLVGLATTARATTVSGSSMEGPLVKAKSATSGQIFTMTVPTRSGHGSELLFQPTSSKRKSSTSSGNLKGTATSSTTEQWPTDTFWNPKGCKNWGTLTTIFPVTEAAADVARLPGWCLVVAGDRKGPETYEIDDDANGNAARVIFLSRDRQEELQLHLSFAARTPWNHFARKNIAFLFAVANGAEFIWDFDDDNALLPGADLSVFTNAITTTTKKTSSSSKVPTTTVLQVKSVNMTQCNSFNPYDFFQASTEDRIWPRGYPLEDIRDPACQLQPTYCRHRIATESIGIYQSVANKDPDVDAIYRLVHELPVNFAGAPLENAPVVIPPHALSPMNAQAALFRRSAFWSLFLPTTVHGRVSDIWRSYIAQALGHQYGMLATFVGPLVRQDRNVHNYLADLQSEVPLYERAGALVDYLLAWKYDAVGGTFEGAMERLYVDLYEYEIIEWEDVVMVQLWLKALQSIGYVFPNLYSSDVPPSAVLETECIHSYEIPKRGEKEKIMETM